MKKSGYIARFLKLSVTAVLVFYVGLNAVVYLYQERLIFLPDRQAVRPPAGMNIEDVRFKTEDGETLHGWWLDGGNGKRTVLFMHGNAGNIAKFAYQMDVFRKLGLNGLMFDYRGYGESSGQIKSEADLYRDAGAAWKFLAGKGVRDGDLIIWGQSLGGGVAAEIAQDKKVRAVILDATFNSMEEMASMTYPYLPTGILLKYRFRTDEKLKNIHAPLLVIHSRADNVVPFEQGRKIYEEAGQPKEFLEVTGSHVGAYFDCEDRYVGGVGGFLKSRCGAVTM